MEDSHAEKENFRRGLFLIQRDNLSFLASLENGNPED
jgi:hypothetical protein